MANNESNEYGLKEMVRDFISPAEYKSPTDLADMGVITVKSVALTETEKYGKSYAVTFEDAEGRAYLSYVSAKTPFAIFDAFKTALIDCDVQFDKITTKDKKTVLKLRLIKSTPEFDKAYKEYSLA